MEGQQFTFEELTTDWRKFMRWHESLPEVREERERAKAARAELAARRVEGRWFSVEECLPPDSYHVLIFSVQCWDPSQQAEMGYCKDGIWWYAMCDVQASGTDHWRPLPTGPLQPEVQT